MMVNPRPTGDTQRSRSHRRASWPAAALLGALLVGCAGRDYGRLDEGYEWKAVRSVAVIPCFNGVEQHARRWIPLVDNKFFNAEAPKALLRADQRIVVGELRRALAPTLAEGMINALHERGYEADILEVSESGEYSIGKLVAWAKERGHDGALLCSYTTVLDWTVEAPQSRSRSMFDERSYDIYQGAMILSSQALFVPDRSEPIWAFGGYLPPGPVATRDFAVIPEAPDEAPEQVRARLAEAAKKMAGEVLDPTEPHGSFRPLPKCRAPARKSDSELEKPHAASLPAKPRDPAD